MSYTELCRNRSLLLLLLSGLLAVVLGFLVLHGVDASRWVIIAGYWFVFATFVIWVFSLWQSFSPDIKALSFRRFDYTVIGLIGVCGGVLLSHEGIGFKILMDEIMLLSTSMSMHFNRLAVVALRGHDINGSFVLMDAILDKRPLFHPFILSLVHDISGYRPENAFILNGILVFVFLSLVAVLGRMFAGRVGAVLGVLLFTGLPLLGQNACGGGFELLNLVMALALVLLGLRWVQKRDEASLCAMCYAGILLVQIRYESVLLALPLIPITLWVWLKERRVVLDWRVAIAPLLLVTYALHHQVFSASRDAYQLLSKPGYEKPFSLFYIPENLAHAAAFYFGKVSDQPNSILFSTLGWILMPLAIVVIYRWLRRLGTVDGDSFVLLAFWGGFGLHFLLMMAYFWGQFDDMVIRRLSLPSHLWLLLAVLIVINRWPKFVKLYWGICAAAGAFVLIVSIPSMSAHTYSQVYAPAREVAWRRDFIKRYCAPDAFVIDNDSTLWITHKISATTVFMALENRDAVAFHVKNHSFSSVYVFQHLEGDEASGVIKVRADDDLGEAYELVPVVEQRFGMMQRCRLSRVVAVHAKAGVVKADEPLVPGKAFKDATEADRMRYQYMENFIKKLP